MKTQTDHMRTSGSFEGRRVLVVGLGRFLGGVSVSRWLAGQGARVTVTDQACADTLQSSLASLADLDIKTQLGGHDASVLVDIDLAIINPAVDKRRSSFFHEIVLRGIPWATELNLFCERCPATVIGVTGTFGKSTTCAMLAHVLGEAQVAAHTSFTNVHLGGNIGRSLLPQLDKMQSRDVVVLELSSAQLEDIPAIDWQPELAIVTNVSEQHIDRHGTFEQYILAKRHILGDGIIKKGVVLGPMPGEAEELFIQRLNTPSDRIIRSVKNGDVIQLRIPGAHNQANAGHVLAACRLLGIEESDVRSALATFVGLAHRLQFVGTLDGVDYYNDSKSTAPAATVSAIESLDRPIVAIVGGRRKSQPLGEWAAAMASRCRVVICMGESGGDFARAIKQQSTACVVHKCDTIASALSYAREVAKVGDVVLFSPGAASFDQFNNYEHRGEVFVESFRAMR